jgi:hypothetical protein
MSSIIADAYRNIFVRSQWNIGVVYQPITSFLNPEFKPSIHWLPLLEDGKFIADPFGVWKDGRVYLLCEEFHYETHKGNISVIEIADGVVTGPRQVMGLPFHMSYPYLLEYQGEIFCVPETYEAKEVAIYQAVDFPTSWQKIVVLIENFAALDSTIFSYDGYWWLMCTNQDVGPHEALFIWYAKDLLGPWMPHPLNPVKKDLASTRPAGTPFRHDGGLYRPAQDCSQYYGKRVVINKIDCLTPTTFCERTVAWVGPYLDSPYPHGLHTLSAVGNITFIDAKRHKFIKKAFISAVKRGFRKIWCEYG